MSNIEMEWDFVNALRPLFEFVNQHMTNEGSGEMEPRTFYHHIDRVCDRQGRRLRNVEKNVEEEGVRELADHCPPYLTMQACHHR